MAKILHTGRFLLPLSLFSVLMVPLDSMATVHYHWVQLQPGKQVGKQWLPNVSVRAIVAAQDACPTLFDDAAKPLFTLTERAKKGTVASGTLFNQIKVCEKNIAADDKLLKEWHVGYLTSDKSSTPIRLPNLHEGGLPLSQVVTSGCTGCRDDNSQYCANTPPAGGQVKSTTLPWLLTAMNQVAAAGTANRLPPLWVHMGDMRYSGQKSAVADSWESTSGKLGWKEEFFQPYAPLMQQSWSVILRGNHEGCFIKKSEWNNTDWADRAEGWLYFFGDGADSCQEVAVKDRDVLTPFAFDAVAFGGTVDKPVASKQSARLVMLDMVRTADGRDLDPKATEDLYKTQYNTVAKRWLHDLSKDEPAWFFQHIPAHEMTKKGKLDTDSHFYKALHNSDVKKELDKVAMIASAHLHQFQVVQLDKKEPVQMIVGNGGVALSGTTGDRCAWQNKDDAVALHSIHFGFMRIQLAVEGKEVTASYEVPLYQPKAGDLQNAWTMVCSGDKKAPLRPVCKKVSAVPPC
ncbi:MAG: metallophosphoesterase [Magnetococcales bacterium]|nr:metallophosphoesterase [Magnetococcales bacterium]MBF0113711.1 metallophosphoesterase [Magnetococcales bacterium]